MRFKDPVQQLQEALREQPLDLFRCALKLAAHAYPKLNHAHYVALMNQWSEELKQRVSHLDDTRIKVEYLNEYFFNVLGFRGNQGDYNNPENSLMNNVMDNRLGIPITLSVLYITMGRSIGLPLSGVSFPGHYLVRINLPEGIVILDAYNRGMCLDEHALAEMLLKHRNTSDPKELVKSLESAGHEETLLRILRNLKSIYVDGEEEELLLQVLNMMLSIAPDAIQERLERGLLLHQMDCHHVALNDLRHYLCETPLNPSDEVLQLVNRLNASSTAIH